MSMPYKLQLGAQEMPRVDWLKLVRRARCIRATPLAHALVQNRLHPLDMVLGEQCAKGAGSATACAAAAAANACHDADDDDEGTDQQMHPSIAAAGEASADAVCNGLPAGDLVLSLQTGTG